jgi:hypothetical protein
MDFDSLSKGQDESFKEGLQRQALEATIKTIQKKIETLVCPVHGQNPKLKFSEDSGPGQQKMSFDCCCETLSRMLQEALKG